MPATSQHRSTSSSNQVPSSSKHEKSKPIPIPGSGRKSRVIIVLPPQMDPPALASSPSHRTAPSPQPVLISSSYPGRNHFGSSPSSSSTPPGVTYNVKISASSGSHPKPRPTFQGAGPSPSSISLHHSGYIPQTSSGSRGNAPNPNERDFTRVTITGPTMSSGSVPIARAASMDTYTRSTVTRGMMMEDDYYSHPAVRAYELQKAAEQARWTRQRQMANAQRKGQNVPQGRW